MRGELVKGAVGGGIPGTGNRVWEAPRQEGLLYNCGIQPRVAVASYLNPDPCGNICCFDSGVKVSG